MTKIIGIIQTIKKLERAIEDQHHELAIMWIAEHGKANPKHTHEWWDCLDKDDKCSVCHKSPSTESEAWVVEVKDDIVDFSTLTCAACFGKSIAAMWEKKV